jgi:hypothetical protein
MRIYGCDGKHETTGNPGITEKNSTRMLVQAPPAFNDTGGHDPGKILDIRSCI